MKCRRTSFCFKPTGKNARSRLFFNQAETRTTLIPFEFACEDEDEGDDDNDYDGADYDDEDDFTQIRIRSTDDKYDFPWPSKDPCPKFSCAHS